MKRILTIGIIIAAVGAFLLVPNRPTVFRLYYNVGETIKVGDLDFVIHGVQPLGAMSYFDGGVGSWVIIQPEPGLVYVAVNLTVRNNGAKEVDQTIFADSQPRFELRTNQGVSYKDELLFGLRGARVLATPEQASSLQVKPFSLINVIGLKPQKSALGQLLFLIPSYEEPSLLLFYEGTKLPAPMLYQRVIPTEYPRFTVKLS